MATKSSVARGRGGARAGARIWRRHASKMSLGEVAELAADYSTQVRNMKRPAKEEINALTMVAADYVESPSFALAVVQVLERSVAEVSHARPPLMCGCCGVGALPVRVSASCTVPCGVCMCLSASDFFDAAPPCTPDTAHERSQVDTHVRVGFYPQKRTAKEGVRRACFQGAEKPPETSCSLSACSRSPVALQVSILCVP